jgi:hypothetical protein
MSGDLDDLRLRQALSGEDLLIREQIRAAFPNHDRTARRARDDAVDFNRRLEAFNARVHSTSVHYPQQNR